MTLLSYSKCSTCKKAQTYLTVRGLPFTERDIKEDHPSEAELRAWQARSGLPLRKFFNSSGQVYRALDLKNKLLDMSEDAQFALLASDGMLVRRPILVGEDFVLVGFRRPDWEAIL